jgi:hypothetical protein
MGWDGKLSNKRSQSEGYNPMLKKRNMSIREVGLRDIIPCSKRRTCQIREVDLRDIIPCSKRGTCQ